MKCLYTGKSPLDYGVNRVVKIQYEISGTMPVPQDYANHRAVLQYLRKHANGVWGYTQLDGPSLVKHLSAYLFFKDDSDYLIFKLWAKYQVTTVTIWPKYNNFCVYEEVQDESELPK